MPIETDVVPLKYRRTKIVATLGPSSTSPEVLSALVDAGADVFRLNMSHGTHETHRLAYERVREVAESRKKSVGVLVDLSGPKIRVGAFEGGGITLERGQEVIVTTRDVLGKDGLIPSQYGALTQDVKRGDRILLDDGALELQVTRVEETEVGCLVRAGGDLTNHKGMNLPGVALSVPSLTPKDREDARFALELGCDFLALSFVRRAADVEDLRALMSSMSSTSGGVQVPIIAKIERPEALVDIDAIVDATDGIMVARGDLGVELPPQSVPLIQIQLTDLARAKAKPVIVATQMLESMVSHSRPTRAEVSDVALAVRSGADAVMLSAESATGKYPVEAVSMMDTVARKTEAYLFHRGAFRVLSTPANGESGAILEGTVEDAMARAMSQLSRDLRVRAIHVISRSGRTTAIMSSSRPAAPIVATSPDPATRRRAGLLWGVIPEWPEGMHESDLHHPEKLTRKLAVKLGFGEEGQKVLLVRGFGTDPRRDTPSITVVTI